MSQHPSKQEKPQETPVQETPPPPAEKPREMRVRVYAPERNPIVSYTLIGLTVLVFLAQIGTKEFLGFDLPVVFGLKVNELIITGQYWRLFTPIFLHADILHIGVNMYSLYVLGPQLEQHYGHWQFLLLYLISGIAGVVASFLFTEHNSLGASTAVFGLLGAYGVFFYQNQTVFSGARNALNRVLQVGALNLVIGLSAGIDNWGHIGGLIGGVVLAWGGGPLYEFSNIYDGERPGVHLHNLRGTDMFVMAAIFTLVTALAAAVVGIFF